MTIPFLRLFQKKSRVEAAPDEIATPPSLVAAAEKPSSESLRKTVMPNATRVVNQTGSFSPGAKSSGSMGRGIGWPPSVMLALEPTVERTISLDLADVL